MTLLKASRREFLVGCSTAIAAMSGSRLSHLVFGSGGSGQQQNVLLYVFLRGGIDGLSLVPPTDGPDRGPYEEARPVLKVPSAGPDAALDLGGQFGLHPAAAPLHSLYQDGKLAIVQAAGMEHDTRSHFDAQEFIELGTPGKKGGGAGWLSRHLQSGPIGEGEITSTSLGPLRPTSLLGDPGTLVLTDTQSYQLNSTDFLWRDAQRRSIRRLYKSQNSFLHDSGVQALDTMDFVEAFVTEDYQPANGATYPQGEFGEQLQVIAQLMKLRVGLSVATLDLGGWDTHDNQGVGGGYFSNLVAGLAQGLAALYLDLDSGGNDNLANCLTLVLQSEFGRRLRENANRGTDHGHGNVMLVMGGSVNGGLYGQWPGLGPEQLFDNADLQVTTDFRRVLSEILIRRLGNPRLGQIFPGYSNYTPLGVVQGDDLLPDYSTAPGQGGGILLK